MQTKELIQSAKEYFRHLLPWMAFFLFDLIGWQFIPRVSGVWFVIGFLILLAGSVQAFHKVRTQRDAFLQKLNDRETTKRALAKLSKLRTDGVALRHEGAKIKIGDDKGFEEWLIRVEGWRSKVRQGLKKLSPAEVNLFETLDTFQPVYIGKTVYDPKDDMFKSDEIPGKIHQLNMLHEETHRIEGALLRWQNRSEF